MDDLRRFTKKSGETTTPIELNLVTVSPPKDLAFHRQTPSTRPMPSFRSHQSPGLYPVRAEGSPDTCPGPISCPNCKQDHDDKNYGLRIEEIRVLEFKERHNLSFAEARIRVKKDSKPSIADATKRSQETPDLDSKIQKAIDNIIGPTLVKLTSTITALAEQQQKTADALSNLLIQVQGV